MDVLAIIGLLVSIFSGLGTSISSLSAISLRNRVLKDIEIYKSWNLELPQSTRDLLKANINHKITELVEPIKLDWHVGLAFILGIANLLLVYFKIGPSDYSCYQLLSGCFCLTVAFSYLLVCLSQKSKEPLS